MKIEVHRVKKSKEELWDPEMQLQFSVYRHLMLFRVSSHYILAICARIALLEDGEAQTLSLANKHSSDIFIELMDLAGGADWNAWKQQRMSLNLPLVDPSTPKTSSRTSPSSKHVSGKKNFQKQVVERPQTEITPDMPDLSKTGAAMVLP